jgi:hypothetical protein
MIPYPACWRSSGVPPNELCGWTPSASPAPAYLPAAPVVHSLHPHLFLDGIVASNVKATAVPRTFDGIASTIEERARAVSSTESMAVIQGPELSRDNAGVLPGASNRIQICQPPHPASWKAWAVTRRARLPEVKRE